MHFALLGICYGSFGSGNQIKSKVIDTVNLLTKSKVSLQMKTHGYDTSLFNNKSFCTAHSQSDSILQAFMTRNILLIQFFIFIL